MNADQSGRVHTISARGGRVASLVLSISLAIALWSSCSQREKPAESGAKQPAPTMPSGALKLSGVLKSLESAGYAPVVEVELEKAYWKVKAYSNGRLLQLKADLMTGAVLPDAPPKLDTPLSDVIKGLEELGYGPILDIERSDTESAGAPAWEIEAYKGELEVKVAVDAAGKVAEK